MSICMAVLAISGSFGNKTAGWVSVVFLFLFNTVFAVGWLGMTWRKSLGFDPLSANIFLQYILPKSFLYAFERLRMQSRRPVTGSSIS